MGGDKRSWKRDNRLVTVQGYSAVSLGAIARLLTGDKGVAEVTARCDGTGSKPATTIAEVKARHGGVMARAQNQQRGYV